MENKTSTTNDRINDSSQISYTKISTEEDSYLDLKETKLDQNNNNYNNDVEMEGENNDDNKDNFNLNKRQSGGILNRKISEYFYMKIGNTYTFFGDKDGSPLIVIGPHWPMYICFSSCISLGYLCFFYYFWSNLSFFIKVVGIIVLLLFNISYTLTFLVNPGIPKYDENAIMGQPKEKYRFCNLCKIWTNMEKNTAHCFDCNVCVEGYDHHCPWTGKCIGRNNLKYFYTFLTSILFVFGYFVLAMTQAQNEVFEEAKRKRKKIHFNK